MKPYETITLILAFAFGLAGAGLGFFLGDAGEYIALFLCIPPPALFYIGALWLNKNRPPTASDESSI